MNFKIAKPIRLIELFAGWGSQHLALKYLGANVESWRICEWAVKSIQAYKDLHFESDNTNYSQNLSKEEIFEWLYHKGISSNYNEPMKFESIKRLGEDKCRQIYNNIFATRNLVNIQAVKGEDLGIEDIDNYEYLMTYSFPCQDLSVAGKQAGMKDTSTRSGMLWEVERILKEIVENGGALPQLLLMENVPQVHGTKNKEHFDRWCKFLEELGYKNFWQDLNAKDYGVPQNRNRTFMVSLLGHYNYSFPQKKELKTKLKDILEKNVDEKYYLTEEKISSIAKWKAHQDPLKDIDKEKQICPCLTARGAGEEHSGMILVNESLWTPTTTIHDASSNIITKEEYAGTFQYAKSDNFMQGKDRFKPNKETSDALQTSQKEGVVMKQNLKTQLCNELILNNKVKENDVIRHSYSNSRMKNMYTQNQTNKDLSPTLDTRCDCLGVVTDYRIRKLTPKECFRLMGVKDKDFEKIAQNQSNASLYHLAGDSIVVDILCEIFKNML